MKAREAVVEFVVVSHGKPPVWRDRIPKIVFVIPTEGRNLQSLGITREPATTNCELGKGFGKGFRRAAKPRT